MGNNPALFLQIKAEGIQGTDQCAIRNGFGEFDIAELVEVNNHSAAIARNNWLLSFWWVLMEFFLTFDEVATDYVVCKNVPRLAGELPIVRVLNDFQPLQILRAN